MSTEQNSALFHSALARHMSAFLTEKRAAGYKYRAGEIYLRDLDRFLTQSAQDSPVLSKEIVERWTAKRPNERDNTHFNRVCIIRQFAKYLSRQGIPAYAPPPNTGVLHRYTFEPRIFTHAEVRHMFYELDHWRRFAHLPLRHIVMPELFRTLYGCGLRVGEALSLRVRDVDLDQGVLTIRHAKFDRERLVPMAPSLLARLRTYADRLGLREPDAYFFPASNGGGLKHSTVYTLFRNILWKMRIPHVGRNHGPRVHDLRHTFAVHRLLQWYQEGADFNAMLPVLSTYLGHQDMAGTQRYLHLIADLFPEVTRRLEDNFGHVIPGGAQ